MKLVLALLLISATILPCWAQESVMLSAAGRRRLQDNIDILKSNKKELDEALIQTRKNMEIVVKEQHDLAELEKEHLALKQKYRSYLEQGAAEAKKNQKAMRDLEKWEKEHRAVSSENSAPAVRSKLDAVQQELTDRLRWQADTDAKLAKMNTLAISLEKNLRDIRARKEPLVAQSKSLDRRRGEIERELQDSNKRLVALEAQLKAQLPSAAPEN